MKISFTALIVSSGALASATHPEQCNEVVDEWLATLHGPCYHLDELNALCDRSFENKDEFDVRTCDEFASRAHGACATVGTCAQVCPPATESPPSCSLFRELLKGMGDVCGSQEVLESDCEVANAIMLAYTEVCDFSGRVCDDTCGDSRTSEEIVSVARDIMLEASAEPHSICESVASFGRRDDNPPEAAAPSPRASEHPVDICSDEWHFSGEDDACGLVSQMLEAHDSACERDGTVTDVSCRHLRTIERAQRATCAPPKDASDVCADLCKGTPPGDKIDIVEAVDAFLNGPADEQALQSFCAVTRDHDLFVAADQSRDRSFLAAAEGHVAIFGAAGVAIVIAGVVVVRRRRRSKTPTPYATPSRPGTGIAMVNPIRDM